MECSSPNCVRNAVNGRRKCRTCYSKTYRAKNPLRATYGNLKQNAKRRGIKFELTLEHWKWFCEYFDYLKYRGRGAEDLTVDRIVDELGYVDGNIQALSNRANVLKRIRKKRGPYVHKPDPECGF